MNARIVLLLGLLVQSTRLMAQPEAIPVRVLALSGSDQNAALGQVLDQRFVVQVVHAQTGAPMPQVRLYIHPNYRTCIPLHPTCTEPPPELYGDFEGSPPQSLVTNDEGIAIAPPFRTGSVAGNYKMMSGLSSDQGGNTYQTVDGFQFALFSIRQVAGTGTGSATSVPGPAPLALALLVLAIIVVASWRWTRGPA